MLIKLISPLVAVLVFIVLPLWLIARRAKAGKSVKKPLIANLCGFFLVMFATAVVFLGQGIACLLYTSPSPRDRTRSRMPSSA